MGGGGENFEKIFLIDININQKIAGFDCTFYNYLDLVLNRSAHKSHQSSNHPKQYEHTFNT